MMHYIYAEIINEYYLMAEGQAMMFMITELKTRPICQHLFSYFFEIGRQADRVKNNFLLTLVKEATSGRHGWTYFDFGLFFLLLKESAASMA